MDAEARGIKRQCEEVRERERFLECERRKNEKVLLDKYFAALKCGPTPCWVSCENLFFQKSVSVVDKVNFGPTVTNSLHRKLPFIVDAPH
jgi:hypothetical protein